MALIVGSALSETKAAEAPRSIHNSRIMIWIGANGKGMSNTAGTRKGPRSRLPLLKDNLHLVKITPDTKTVIIRFTCPM